MTLANAEVLVVEDEQLTLRTLDRALRTAGARVTTARTLPDGRALAARRSFDAAVVDLWLHGQSAGELVTVLKAAAQPTSALVITAQNGMEAARQSLAVGADDFLLKPFETGAFLGAVARTVERTRNLREPPAEEGAPAAAPPAEHEHEQEHEPGRRKKMIAWPGPRTLGLLDLAEVVERLATLSELSEKERAVLEQMLVGRHNVEIAAELELTERTVKFHASNVFRKLSVGGRNDLPSLFFRR